MYQLSFSPNFVAQKPLSTVYKALRMGTKELVAIKVVPIMFLNLAEQIEAKYADCFVKQYEAIVSDQLV